MADKPRPSISDAERMVLKMLWDHGPKTVREVHQLIRNEGQDWTRSTVITLLQRLEKKGYVASDKGSFAFVFRAVVSLEDLMHQRLSELADELAGGDAIPLVLAFTQRHRFTSKELQQFRDLINQVEEKNPRRKSGK